MIRFRIIFVLTLQLSTVAEGQDVLQVINPLEHGMIRSGQRAGLWQYFDYPGELGLEIDYETMRVTHLQPDSSLFVVKEGDRWVRQQLKSPCRPHGSIMLVLDHFFNNLHSHQEIKARARKRNEPVQTTLTFEVGPEGVASNPKVWGYSGFGMKKLMVKTFDTAPNVWIPGVKMDGSTATCRFGVYIKICPDTCAQIPASDTVRILYGLSHNRNRQAEPSPWTNERAGIVFSPEDQHIAVGASLLSQTGGNGFFIISIKDASYQYIPYGTIKSMYWEDNHTISFKYTYSLSAQVKGRYDVVANRIESRRDSTTFFEHLSPDRKVLFQARLRGKFLETVKTDLVSGKSEWLDLKPGSNIFPVSWSPDQRYVVLKTRSGNFDQGYLYELSSGTLRMIPVMDTDPCGWTADGSVLYLQQSRFNSGKLFSVNSRTMGFIEMADNIDNFMGAQFSPSANQFLFLRRNNLFLMPPVVDAKPLKIADNVTYAVWNRAGTSIAYVSEKGMLLSLYDVQSARSRILINRSKRN